MVSLIDILLVLAMAALMGALYGLCGMVYQDLTVKAQKAVKRHRRRARVQAVKNTVLYPIRKVGLIS